MSGCHRPDGSRTEGDYRRTEHRAETGVPMTPGWYYARLKSYQGLRCIVRQISREPSGRLYVLLGNDIREYDWYGHVNDVIPL